MWMTSERRRHPCRRMLLVIVILSILAKHSEQAMLTRRLQAESSSLFSSSSPSLPRNSAESKPQNLGSPSELAWQAWLLLDSQTGAHSTFLRRIKPKSVFIAPALTPCADGYSADTMGRCVKSVNINHEAHLGFLVQKLNSRYGNKGNSDASNSNAKKSSGPLQLNIPLLSEDKSSHVLPNPLQVQETRDSIKIPIIIPSQEKLEESKRQSLGTIITVYQALSDNSKSSSNKKEESDTNNFQNTYDNNNTKSDYESQHTQSTTSRLETVVPVADFADDENDTNLSDVVDYKIPIDLRVILNPSSLRTVMNITERQELRRNESQLLNSTEPSPMLVLLSPTTTSSNNSISVDLEEDLIVDNSTELEPEAHRAVARTSNLTRNDTDIEVIDETVPETESPSKDLEVPLFMVEKIEDNETRDGNLTEIDASDSTESQELKAFYDDDGETETEAEDYADSTDMPKEFSKQTDRTVVVF